MLHRDASRLYDLKIGNHIPEDEAVMQPGSGDTTKCDLAVLDRSLIERTNEPGAFGKVGSFHLQEELGRGGMGVVFKAWDDSLRRVVAVKFIRQDRSLSSAAHERFFREARAAAAVSHPNIVVVHRIDEVKATPFIVMEYVDGESLEKLIAKGRRFTSSPYSTPVRTSRRERFCRKSFGPNEVAISR